VMVEGSWQRQEIDQPAAGVKIVAKEVRVGDLVS
jgi:hypothetical protein